MKKFCLLLLCAMYGLSVAGADKVFHFDFNAPDKDGVLRDRTGKVECRSLDRHFARAHQALRLAEGVRIRIPGAQIPDISEQFSCNIWVNTARRGIVNPVFSMGERPGDLRFSAGVTHLFPDLIYNNIRGCGTSGSPGGHVVNYNQKYAIVGKKPFEVLPGRWHMLTYVFDRGTIRIYSNGKLILNAPSAKPEKLNGANSDLILGAERFKDNNVNHSSANMLVNDWRFYRGVLSPEEIQAIYQQEQAKYTKIVMQDTWAFFPECPDYMERQIPGYDPLFRYKLKMTAEFEKNLPQETKKTSPLRSDVRTKNRVTSMFVNDKEYFPLMNSASPDNHSIRNPLNTQFKQVRDFAAAGYPLTGGSIHTWRDMPIVWQGPGKYNFALFDELVNRLQQASPTGWIQVSIFPEAISWFQGKHNTHLERAYAGHTGKGPLRLLYSAPYGSEVWLSASTELLGELIKHMEKQPYANRIYDYKLFCGGGGEWYWPGCFMGVSAGYSEATRDTFRKFLSEKYKTDDALHKAWGRTDVTPATALVPSPEERFSGECFNFRDPVKGRASMDFREYMGRRTLLNLTANTKAMKEATGGKKTITIYYGYGIFFSSSRNPTQQTSGIQHLAEVMRLPWVDHIATPLSYNRRRGGDPGANYNPFNGSARLHNKLLWQENDLRTHVFPKNEYGRTRDAAESTTVIRRGYGQALTSGMGMWFLALPGYAYHEESVMKATREIREQSEKALKRDRSSVAEIALIFDEPSMKSVAFRRDNFINAHIFDLYEVLYRVGAPFDAYLAEDLADPRMPDYKLYLFVNLFEPTEKVRTAAKNKIRRGGVALFSYAPGFLRNHKFDDQAMADLTGIKLKSEMKEHQLKLEQIDFTHPLSRNIGKQAVYPVGPVIEVVDPQAKILARAGKYNALAVRDFGKWSSVYSLMPPTLEMLVGLCDYAGVHRYSKTADVLGANKSYIMLHASSAGDKTIHLKRPAAVREVFSGKILGGNVKNFTDRNVPNEATRIYEITEK